MQAVRHLLAQRHLTVLICAATLLLKLLVPSGYMIDNDHGHVAITICSGVGPAKMAMAMPSMQGEMPAHGNSKEGGKAEMPCAFAGFSAALLGAIDPIQFAALIVFIMAVGLAATALSPARRRAYLRPPLRGPPAIL